MLFTLIFVQKTLDLLLWWTFQQRKSKATSKFKKEKSFVCCSSGLTFFTKEASSSKWTSTMQSAMLPTNRSLVRKLDRFFVVQVWFERWKLFQKTSGFLIIVAVSMITMITSNIIIIIIFFFLHTSASCFTFDLRARIEIEQFFGLCLFSTSIRAFWFRSNFV